MTEILPSGKLLPKVQPNFAERVEQCRSALRFQSQGYYFNEFNYCVSWGGCLRVSAVLPRCQRSVFGHVVAPGGQDLCLIQYLPLTFEKRVQSRCSIHSWTDFKSSLSFWINQPEAELNRAASAGDGRWVWLWEVWLSAASAFHSALCFQPLA